MKMKKNILILLIWAIIMTIVVVLNADPANFVNEPIFMVLFLLSYYYVPLFLVLIINKITDIQKTEKAKKVCRIITIIINILATIYLLITTLITYAVIHMFD